MGPGVLDVPGGLCRHGSYDCIGCYGREDQIYRVFDLQPLCQCHHLSDLWKLGMGVASSMGADG